MGSRSTPGHVPRSIPDDALRRFIERLRARLVAGAEDYGGSSFTRSHAAIVDEVMQELEDVCGWSLILWTRLDRLRARLEGTDLEGGHDGHS